MPALVRGLLLTGSLAGGVARAGLIGNPSDGYFGKTISVIVRDFAAQVGLTDVVFPRPVFHGYTLRAESEVLDTRTSRSRPDAGIVTVEHRAINQRGEVVARCKRTALMQRRP